MIVSFIINSYVILHRIYVGYSTLPEVILMEWVMLAVFRLVEEYVSPSILTVSALFFVVFLGGEGKLCIKIFLRIRQSSACRT
jgi:hypothetical protein